MEQCGRDKLMKYASLVPLAHTLRYKHTSRWFRIHSLPQAKRYPESHYEWGVLLHRNNSVITDLIGEKSAIKIIKGIFHSNDGYDLNQEQEIEFPNGFKFQPLRTIDLFHLQGEDYEEGQFFTPFFCEANWSSGKFDDILRDIALDKVRVYFVDVEKDTFVAPYDGGIDFVVRDAQLCDEYKMKYKEWLSDREDGL